MKQEFIVRTCPECGQSFVAGNRTQRFCCEKCNAAFYFQVRKKMQAYLSQVEDEPDSKTHFTVTETSDILGVSVSTVYRLLKSRKLYAERLSKKETLVSLKSIESYKAYLKSDQILAQRNAYTIDDLMELAGVGMTSAYILIKKHNISPAQITRLKRNESVSTHTIEIFCKILNCNVEDVMQYINDEQK
jgi:excisionase family DNA binding protein